ncbi:Uncharacterised protein [Mycobacterium tuberculosis]|uniref:Uncharacterized protein n=1 Tax=Mycobacterium tuberculosis TaxID=1773 RepID=A0A654U8D2_MYCTX|nr:Uncharacterised protein [Mycobacterium tuberculosis]CFS34773.1 Uncharacterised protein [Mycobacterium tuberculosis]
MTSSANSSRTISGLAGLVTSWVCGKALTFAAISCLMDAVVMF